MRVQLRENGWGVVVRQDAAAELARIVRPRRNTGDLLMFSTRIIRDTEWAEIKHFGPDEFDSPNVMGVEFIEWLDQVREAAGVPMHITSSYRTAEYNEKIGGATDSAHIDIPCNAVDIGARPRPDDPNWNASRYAIVEAAIRLGCKRIGTYQNGSLHLDMTHDKRPAPRMWLVVR